MFGMSRFILPAVLVSLTAAVFAPAACAQNTGCVAPTPFNARPFYMMNPGPVGSCSTCAPDMDADLVEYLMFLGEHGPTAPVQGIVGDFFGACDDGAAHGEFVVEYFMGFGPPPSEILFSTSLPDLVDDMVVAMEGAAAVGSLSVSESPTATADPLYTAALTNAFNSGLLLVGVPQAFEGQAKRHGHLFIQIHKMDQTGSPPVSHFAINEGVVFFAAAWDDPATGALITANPTAAIHHGASHPDYDFVVDGYTDTGSFITPMAAGTMPHIMAIVANRGLTGSELVQRTIDCVMSSCDHPDDSFAVRTGNMPGYAPWSAIWAYGVYNPWKALVYAAGYGSIASQDANLYGIANPTTSFNDDFELRGDLLVGAGQHLAIGAMATVSVVPGVPGGPNYGRDPSRHEILVDGQLTIDGAVEASLIVGAGGLVTVSSSGHLEIGPEQSLIVEPGGVVEVEGGTLVLAGETRIEGGISFEPGATLTIAADLWVGVGGTLAAGPGVVIAVGETDLGASGLDAAEVELRCSGRLVLEGQPGNPVVVRAANPGSGDWYGVVLDSDAAAGSTVRFVEISDADTGLFVGGSTPLAMSNDVFSGNRFGLELSRRNGDVLTACTFSGADVGLVLEYASPAVGECVIQGNIVGVHCGAGARPKLRDTTLADNNVGVRVVGAGALPDLGTDVDPGNNQILAPVKNQLSVVAFGPTADIMAQHNWWGTTSAAAIAGKIRIIDSSRQVLFMPILASAPGSAPFPPGTTGTFSEAAPGEDAGTALALFAHGDDPSDPGLVLSFHLPQAGQVDLVIYDVRGRRIRTLIDGPLDRGPHSIRWDGRDANGSRAARGVYLARLVSAGREVSRKVVLSF